MNDIDFLEKNAVDAAINIHWADAIRLNLEIEKIDSTNISALLRLGFAYLHINKPKDAKKYYRKALKIQPHNTVALENLEKLKIIETKGFKKTSHNKKLFNPTLFIELPGKTRTITLVNHGQKNSLARITAGQEVELKIKKRRVEIRTLENDYIGSLPDDISKRLAFLIRAKCLYSAHIKEAGLNHITVFIKEEKKGKQAMSLVSFPTNIHKPMVLSNIEDNEDRDEDIEDDTIDWEKMASDMATEEKEVVIGIQTDDEDDDDEE